MSVFPVAVGECIESAKCVLDILLPKPAGITTPALPPSFLHLTPILEVGEALGTGALRGGFHLRLQQLT